MHYKDGTEAKVGDLVKGTAYNTKNTDGTPRQLIATMLQITPGSESCYCVVAFMEMVDVSKEEEAFIRNQGLYCAFPLFTGREGTQRLVAKNDYSECRAFELVHRPE